MYWTREGEVLMTDTHQLLKNCIRRLQFNCFICLSSLNCLASQTIKVCPLLSSNLLSWTKFLVWDLCPVLRGIRSIYREMLEGLISNWIRVVSLVGLQPPFFPDSFNDTLFFPERNDFSFILNFLWWSDVVTLIRGLIVCPQSSSIVIVRFCSELNFFFTHRSLIPFLNHLSWSVSIHIPRIKILFLPFHPSFWLILIP